MHLIYMPECHYKFGYQECEEDMAMADKYGLQAMQMENESREDFFTRINDRPSSLTYGSDEVLDARFLDNKATNLLSYAELGYAKEKLVFCEYVEVLAKLLECWDYGAELLVNNDNPAVRAEVARQGHYLDILVKDESPAVRFAVASRGYGLNTLINDPEVFVRLGVVKNRYKLDVLAEDKDVRVRREVALYADSGVLDKLMQDDDIQIKKIIIGRGHRLDWYAENETSTQVLPDLINAMVDRDEFYWIAAPVVHKLESYNIDSYIHLINKHCKFTTKEDFDKLDELEALLDSENYSKYIQDIRKKYN